MSGLQILKTYIVSLMTSFEELESKYNLIYDCIKTRKNIPDDIIALFDKCSADFNAVLNILEEKYNKVLNRDLVTLDDVVDSYNEIVRHETYLMLLKKMDRFLKECEKITVIKVNEEDRLLSFKQKILEFKSETEEFLSYLEDYNKLHEFYKRLKICIKAVVLSEDIDSLSENAIDEYSKDISEVFGVSLLQLILRNKVAFEDKTTLLEIVKCLESSILEHEYGKNLNPEIIAKQHAMISNSDEALLDGDVQKDDLDVKSKKEKLDNICVEDEKLLNEEITSRLEIQQAENIENNSSEESEFESKLSNNNEEICSEENEISDENLEVDETVESDAYAKEVDDLDRVIQEYAEESDKELEADYKEDDTEKKISKIDTPFSEIENEVKFDTESFSDNAEIEIKDDYTRSLVDEAKSIPVCQEEYEQEFIEPDIMDEVDESTYEIFLKTKEVEDDDLKISSVDTGECDINIEVLTKELTENTSKSELNIEDESMNVDIEKDIEDEYKFKTKTIENFEDEDNECPHCGESFGGVKHKCGLCEQYYCSNCLIAEGEICLTCKKLFDKNFTLDKELFNEFKGLVELTDRMSIIKRIVKNKKYAVYITGINILNVYVWDNKYRRILFKKDYSKENWFKK